MACPIAPPCSVVPMTKEDVAIVQAEKRMDANTREQLVKVYGDSKAARGKAVALVRPGNRSWVCPSCRHRSIDIRRVCGHCLAMEPSSSGGGGKAKTPSSTTAQQGRRPGTSCDDGVRLLTVQSTGRTYRQFCEPITAVVAKVDGGVSEADQYYDEPECEAGGEGATACRLAADDDTDAVFDNNNNNNNNSKNAADASRPKPPDAASTSFTHFLSLPIGKLDNAKASCDRLLAELTEFVVAGEAGGEGSGVASSSSSSGLATDCIAKTPKLHMTLLLLRLATPRDIDFAKELLNVFAQRWADVKKGLQSPAVHAGKCQIHLGGGLHVMPDRKTNKVSLNRAGVVYMAPKDDASTALIQQLQTILHESMDEVITDREEAALSRKTLHMTLLNKKWRKSASKRPFDASGIVERFRNASVGGEGGRDGQGPVILDCVELNRLSGGDRETDTYYVEASVKI